MKTLLLLPIIFLMYSYVAIKYSLLYIFFTTYTFVFEVEYGFSSRNAGLAFLRSRVGMLLGLGFAGTQSDKRIRRKIASVFRLVCSFMDGAPSTMSTGLCLKLETQ